jgi:predicted glutamine amidotransferase
MCKLFAMTDMSKIKITEKFINAVKNEVCKHSDKDGFGYSIQGKDNSLGGERTLLPFGFKPFDTLQKKVVSDLPIVQVNSNRFGSINTLAPKSFMAHGRFSTNSVSLANTHPFYVKGISLIHNGVVQDTTLNVNHLLKTNCDTEILLRYWETQSFDAITKNVSGYYAIMVQDSKGKLHVIRDDRAVLYITWIESLNTFMLATTIDIIQGVCKKMKWKCEQPEMVTDNTYAIFNGNEIESHTNFNPVGSKNYGMSETERKALGLTGYEDTYSIDDKWKEIDAYSEEAPAYKDLTAVDDYMRTHNLKDVPDNIDDVDESVLSYSAKDLMKKYGNYGRKN